MEVFDIEKMKKCSGTCCCLDYNMALGKNLEEKLQIIYCTMVRMQYITRKISGKLPNVVLVQPLMNAIFEVTGVLKPADIPSVEGYESAGRIWDKWDVYIDEKAWMEHHIMMTNLNDGKFPLDPKIWCKISLLNMVMANNFGYYNMEC